MTLADRLIVMNGGVAEQIGTPLDVYREPASVFVAGFIGSPAMNFLPGTITDGGRSVTLDGSGPVPAGPVAGSRRARRGHRRHPPRAPRSRLPGVGVSRTRGRRRGGARRGLPGARTARGRGRGAGHDGPGRGGDADRGRGTPFISPSRRNASTSSTPQAAADLGEAGGRARRTMRSLALLALLGLSMTAQGIEIQGHRGGPGAASREHPPIVRARHRARGRRAGARPWNDPRRRPRRAPRPGPSTRSRPGTRPAGGWRSARGRSSTPWTSPISPSSTSDGPPRAAGPRNGFRGRSLATAPASRPLAEVLDAREAAGGGGAPLQHRDQAEPARAGRNRGAGGVRPRGDRGAARGGDGRAGQPPVLRLAGPLRGPPARAGARDGLPHRRTALASTTSCAAAPGPSPWTAGLDIDAFGGSVPRLVEAAGCTVWSPFYRDLTEETVVEAHALGLRVVVWTVNEVEDMLALARLGVDGIITDYPDRAVEALAPLTPRPPGRVSTIATPSTTSAKSRRSD